MEKHVGKNRAIRLDFVLLEYGKLFKNQRPGSRQGLLEHVCPGSPCGWFVRRREYVSEKSEEDKDMAYLGEEIRKLGFGLMRLPRNGEVIDVEQTKVMVDRFMEAGFTYFDTAWAYAGSEDAIRQALVERYPRESFQQIGRAHV